MARLLAYVVCFIVMQALPLEKKPQKELNDTHMEEHGLYWIQVQKFIWNLRNLRLAASNFFRMFTQSIKFF